MHPEVQQLGPGTCPKCGMALEPVQPSADQGEPDELRDMRRRFTVSAILTLPVFALAMGEMLPGRPFERWLAPAAQTWVQWLLATPVVRWGGWPFFVRGVDSVRRRQLNMFTLIALGVGVAYLYSVVATLAPGLFPPALHAAQSASNRSPRSARFP